MELGDNRLKQPKPFEARHQLQMQLQLERVSLSARWQVSGKYLSNLMTLNSMHIFCDKGFWVLSREDCL